MVELKLGDVVARKSYGSDILFKVVDIRKDGDMEIVVLKGICYRLEADAPKSDLIIQSETCINEYNASFRRSVDLKARSVYQ
ncbi:MAG: hypothetical protein GX660_00450 [Clostridiaceae bacterium]|nr:hypothetical protein [Clostridiaceae bacterium]